MTQKEPGATSCLSPALGQDTREVTEGTSWGQKDGDLQGRLWYHKGHVVPSQQPELISVPKVPPQGPLQHLTPPVPSSQEEQRPEALVTPNGSCCYQTQLFQEGSSHRGAADQGMLCSHPRLVLLGLDRAARGVWEVETIVFHPIPFRNTGCDVLGVLLSPPGDFGAS